MTAKSPYRTSAEQHSRTLDGSANLNSAPCTHSIEQPYEHPYPLELTLCAACGHWRWIPEAAS